MLINEGADKAEERFKVGETIWYAPGNDDMARQHAVILELDGNTQLKVRIVTGPEAGKELTIPIGIGQKLSSVKEQ